MEQPTIPVHKLQAGRLKSDKRKDKDQRQDFCKEQGIH